MVGTVLLVSAQTSSVTATVTPGAPVITPGSGVWLGNVVISNSSGNNVQVSSIPLQLATGFSGGNLSSCQFYDQSMKALNTGSKVLNTVQSGSNTVMFDTALSVPANSSVSLSLRCNVASSNTATTTTVFTPGTPTVISTTTPTPTTTPNTDPNSTSLSVLLSTATSVKPGAQDAPLAVISLRAGGASNVSVQALPLNIGFGSGMANSYVSDCRVRNLSNLGSPLNAVSSGGINAGSNTITLDSAFTVPAGVTSTLVLTCDVFSSAPIGGTMNVSISPSSLAATAANGVSVTPTTGTNVNGQAGSTSGTVLVVSSTDTPGLPNTGSGGEAFINIAALIGCALFALLGYQYLRRRV